MGASNCQPVGRKEMRQSSREMLAPNPCPTHARFSPPKMCQKFRTVRSRLLDGLRTHRHPSSFLLLGRDSFLLDIRDANMPAAMESSGWHKDVDRWAALSAENQRQKTPFECSLMHQGGWLRCIQLDSPSQIAQRVEAPYRQYGDALSLQVLPNFPVAFVGQQKQGQRFGHG